MVDVGHVGKLLRAEAVVAPHRSEVLEVEALRAQEAHRHNGHGLQDEHVLDDSQVDARHVVHEQRRDAHYGDGDAHRGQLPCGEAEHELFAVVVDLFGDACFKAHWSVSLHGAADTAG